MSNSTMIESSRAALHVAVIGAGPSGLFAAGYLLNHGDFDVRVDVYERLPIPFGLVHHGVAPDHAKLKSVSRALQRTLVDPRVRFLGNVEVGRRIGVEDLREHYHAVLVATGGVVGKSLGVAGEDAVGCRSAADFAAWYNGHPDHTDDDYDVSGRVVIVGNGNVALDVARVLARTPTELANTDIAEHAAVLLAGRTDREILVLGRRGPDDVSFTKHELHELGDLAGAQVRLAETDASGLGKGWKGTAFRELADTPRSTAAHTITFAFHRGVEELITRDSDGRTHVTGIRVNGPGGTTDVIDASLVLLAVGTGSASVGTLEVDPGTGRIRADDVRVVDLDGTPLNGVYVTGWARRGATGIIGTNKKDAASAVDAIIEDARRPGRRIPSKDRQVLFDELLASGDTVVDAEAWLRIDEHESAAAHTTSKPRVKLTRTDQMLAVARGGADPHPTPSLSTVAHAAPLALPEEAALPKWFCIGSLDATAEEGWVHNAVVRDRELALTRVGSQWHAFADMCTHADCSLSDFGEVVDGEITCNCHGSRFDLVTGEALCPPAVRPLDKIPVRVTEGKVEVLIGGGDT